MRVLLWMIPEGKNIPGGHRVQLDQTCAHLRALGVDAAVTFEEAPSLADIDIVHAFGLMAYQLHRCREAGVKIAYSTIYWSVDYRTVRAARPLNTAIERTRHALVLLRAALQGRHYQKCDAYVAYSTRYRVAYEMADLLLPNSQMEADAIKNELGVTTPALVAPNAVDASLFTLPEKPGSGGYVLYSGRFGLHKNQLGLIEALRNTSIPVKLVGPPSPSEPEYYERCRRRATANIEIVPGVPHEELVPLYQAARVHVVPSWFETTGLVSLEAALCGCNIVTTDRGYTKEYFQDLAWYCDPADRRTIRKAVEQALAAPLKPDLRDRILNNYTWEHTAAATLEGYKSILTNRGAVRSSAGAAS